jgi:hypothetical protein
LSSGLEIFGQSRIRLTNLLDRLVCNSSLLCHISCFNKDCLAPDSPGLFEWRVLITLLYYPSYGYKSNPFTQIIFLSSSTAASIQPSESIALQLLASSSQLHYPNLHGLLRPHRSSSVTTSTESRRHHTSLGRVRDTVVA